MGATRFISMRELRMSTGKIKEMLDGNDNIILTTNGKPTALMIGVDEEILESTLLGISSLKARIALNEINRVAEENGTAYMTDEEINAEIEAVRRERREREARADNNESTNG